MNKYRVRIVPTEGDVIDTVMEGESEEDVRSRFMTISTFRQTIGEPTIMNIQIKKIKK